MSRIQDERCQECNGPVILMNDDAPPLTRCSRCVAADRFTTKQLRRIRRMAARVAARARADATRYALALVEEEVHPVTADALRQLIDCCENEARSYRKDSE